MNSFKILLLGALVLALGGCTEETSGWEVNQIVDFCEARGGVSSINNVLWTSSYCLDGKYFDPSKRLSNVQR